MFALSVFLFLVAFVLHWFFPKELTEQYFRSPYFNAAEIVMFSGFPLGYVRTAMFFRLLGFSGSGKKRGLPNEIGSEYPKWKVFSRYWVFAFVFCFSTFLVLTFILMFFID